VGPDDTSRGYLRFALPVPGRRVLRAVLWVYGAIPKDPETRESDMLAHPLRARGPALGEWSETTLTWNNAPDPGPALGSDWVTTYPDWAGLDVTGAVRKCGTEVTLVLDQEEPGHQTFLHGRTAAAARRFFERAIDRSRVEPARVTTDRAGA
jgi:hypothetical protein